MMPIVRFLDWYTLRLQHSIVATMYFLKQFYGFSPNIQLRNMYLRWNLGE